MIHIKKEQQKVSTWSGGTTREIYIYPEGSNYITREFDFRLSTATVECETSNFTPLPEVHRHLMILEGTLELTHVGHYQKTLNPFDCDEFEGNWETSSIGKVIDFNLMLKKGKGKLYPYHSAPRFGEEGDLHFLYLHTGSINCEGQKISSGDIVFWDKMPEKKDITGEGMGVTGQIIF